MTTESVRNLLSMHSLKFLDACKFDKLSEVQIKVIPAFMSHQDVVVRSFTGSGKTLGFLIPIFEILLRRKNPLSSKEIGALIISPTRELARQIFSVATKMNEFFSPNTTIRIGLFVGGEKVEDNPLNSFESLGNIIIGTPGRLCKVLRGKRTKLNFKEFEVLILDEADRLMDTEFEKEIEKILSCVPKQRRTGLFSATKCYDLARMGLRNHVEINVDDNVGPNMTNCPQQMKNYYTVVSPEQKLPSLVKFFNKNLTTKYRKIIVFFLTCAMTDYFYFLTKKFMDNINLYCIHGKTAKTRRKKIMQSFRDENTACVLFSTDLMARGIDIADIDLIIQFDIPKNPEFFVHRIGRTARMGRKGHTLLFISPFEEKYLEVLQSINIPIVEMDEIDNQTKKTSKCLEYRESIRKWAKNDREVMEKGVTAFVSYIRGYKEHFCREALDLKEMPFAQVANEFGLIYFPKIKGIKEYPKSKKGDQIKDFEEMNDINKIEFADKTKQKNRLERLENARITREEKIKNAKEKAKVSRKLKKQGIKRRRKLKQSENQRFLDEWDQLARETTLYKKFKKNKISKEEYEIAVGEKKSNK